MIKGFRILFLFILIVSFGISWIIADALSMFLPALDHATSGNEIPSWLLFAVSAVIVGTIYLFWVVGVQRTLYSLFLKIGKRPSFMKFYILTCFLQHIVLGYSLWFAFTAGFSEWEAMRISSLILLSSITFLGTVVAFQKESILR